MQIEFTIPGRPEALKRHRMTKTGHAYDPSATSKADFLAKAMSMRPEKPFEGPLRMVLDFCFQRPNNHFNSKGLKPNAPNWYCPRGRNDWDNLCKFVSDALNGMFYEDDGQIVSASVTKRYSDQACVHVMIEEI